MHHVVLLSDLFNFPVPSKTAGPHRIASNLRKHNYRVKVIEHFDYFLNLYPEEFLKALGKFITPETLILGISTTWCQNLHQNFTKNILKLLGFVRTLSPNIKIVIGGNSMASLSFFNRYEAHIDFWIQGHGETASLKLLASLEGREPSFSDKIIKTDVLAHEFDFANAPPMFDPSDIVLKNEVLPLEISRGCRFRCKFCAFPLLGRNPKNEQYIRSTYSISKELELNYRQWKTDSYFMMCDTFNESTEKLLKIKKAVDDVGIKIQFSAYVRLDLLYVHPEQIDILNQLGIRAAFFGIESLHDPAARAIGKALGKDRILSTLEKVKQSWDSNCILHGSFIVGLPKETHQTASEWAEFLCAGLTPLTSFKFYPLALWKNRVVYSSEFESNAEKYGYRFNSNMDWDNGEWTWRTAIEFANFYTLKAINEGTIGVNSWMAMALRNLNWSWEKIRRTKHKDLFNNPLFMKDRHTYYLSYLTQLLDESAKSANTSHYSVKTYPDNSRTAFGLTGRNPERDVQSVFPTITPYYREPT